MKALITGANGFLGSHLARRMAARGDEVRCLVREGSDRSALDGASVQIVSGDVVDKQTLRDAVRGVDVVFHLAGIRRAPTRDLFFAVNAEGTRNVCEAMVEAGARRLVLAGSLAASGPSKPDRPRREEDPFAPSEWYGESKAEAERLAFTYAGRLEVTSVRPVRIIGPGDRENLPFFKIVKKGVRLHILGPPRPISFVDVDDVVDLTLLVAERPEAVGHAFFSSGEALSLLEMQDVLAEILGVRPRTIPLPPLVLKGLASAADVVSRATGKHLPLNRKLARQLLAPGWTCSSEKAERVLGFRSRRSIRDSIQRSADWYRAQGWL